MPRPWQEIVESDEYSNVMRLIHLSSRKDQVDQSAIQSELLKIRRRAYEQELTIQARRVGCNGRQGRLTTGESLTELNEMSAADAESIVRTYNADLALQIAAIRSEVPTANRYVYAKRLSDWDTARSSWKLPQIAEFTENTARAMAQRDFIRNNNLGGYAVLEPRTAKEGICRGWINRGRVPVEEAVNNPTPFHPRCPHTWRIQAEKIPRNECESIWSGE